MSMPIDARSAVPAAQLPATREHWRAPILTVSLFVLLSLVVWGWVAAEPAGGPLSDGVGGLTSSQVLPGQWGVAGMITGRLRGTQPVVITSIRPAHPDQVDGMHLRYGVPVSPHQGILGATRGWQPQGYPVKSYAGTVVRPGQRFVFVVGAESRSYGYHEVVGFLVTYRIGLHSSFTDEFAEGVGVRVTRP